jgi:hypothetical protein
MGVLGSLPRGYARALPLLLCILLAPQPARGIQEGCRSALGPLASAKLDQAVTMVWETCHCDWKARRLDGSAEKSRRAFVTCVKTEAKSLVEARIVPDACSGELVASATLSTCGGLADGAVTCCVPTADGCLVVGPTGDEATSDSASSKSPGTGRERCLGMRGAAIGGSESCYDACPPPGMTACTGKQDVEAASKRAEERIAAAQGKPFDITDPKQAALLFLQTPHEYGCSMPGRITGQFGPRR